MAMVQNPFIAVVPRKLSCEELAQAIRVDLTGEYEAIIGYEAHMQATDDERVKKTLRHIADEEQQHVGELQQLLAVLSPQDAQQTEKGRQAIVTQQQSNFQAPLQ